MSARALIEVGIGETRAALVEDGKLVALAAERGPDFDRGADIVLGRVLEVSARMKMAKIALPGEAVGMLGLKEGRRLAEGAAILVQIERAAHRLKGPRVTTDIALAGRFLVYRPHQRGIAFARGFAESAALGKSWAKLGKLGGFTLRAPIEGTDPAWVEAEVAKLKARWQRIEAAAKSAKAPAMIEEDVGPVLRLLRDAPKLERVLIDDAAEAARLKSMLAPDLAGIVERAAGLFVDDEIDAQIAEALASRVELPGGIAIAIEETEALVAIDVDVGAAVDLPTACKRAAKEIARQIRLRRLGGQIVVDFPRLAKADADKKLVEVLREALARDPEPIEFGGRTRLGLVEFRRRRRGPALGEILGRTPRSCGPGMATRLRELLRQGLRDARARPGSPITLAAPDDLIRRLQGADAPLLDDLRRLAGVDITLQARDG